MRVGGIGTDALKVTVKYLTRASNLQNSDILHGYLISVNVGVNQYIRDKLM